MMDLSIITSFLLLFLMFDLVYPTNLFTEKQKNEIIRQHKQRLANEAMRIFEDRLNKPITTSPHHQSIFDQMVNYKGLYENLNIRNVSVNLMIESCHKNIQPLLGVDYKRHQNRHHLVCFSSDAFLVQTFHVERKSHRIVFDPKPYFDLRKASPERLLQMKFFRKYDTDQLFLFALLHQGVQKIRTYEVISRIHESPSIIDKQLLHSFKVHEQATMLDVVHFDQNQYQIVALIDSGHQLLNEFSVEVDPNLVRIYAHQALRLRTMRIQTKGFIVVANTTHWVVYRHHQDGQVDLINMFMMKYFIKDLQLFSNGHRYYCGVVTPQEQYIYQWMDSKQGFKGVARMRNRMAYKMNAITLSYSRQDNFFYFDQLDNIDTMIIYGYDLASSNFILLKKMSKTKDLNLAPDIVFNPFYSAQFYDRNFAYELKLSDSKLYLFTYETTLLNYEQMAKEWSRTRQTKSDIHNLHRYNKQIYEKRIEKLTKNVFKLDQQETISKHAVNLTLNFNVTFRGKVRVNRFLVYGPQIPEKVYINRRDYAYEELRVSFEKLQQQIDQITLRMNTLDWRLNTDVVYRNQNTRINGMKYFIGRIWVKKIYARQAWIEAYRRKNVTQILFDLYRIDQDKPITARKTFQSNIRVDRFLLANRINSMDLDDFLYTDLDQDVYSIVWYRDQLYADLLLVSGGQLSSNVSLKDAVFINQLAGQNQSSGVRQYAHDPILFRNKLVFDTINVDNLYVDTVDGVRIKNLYEKTLNRHAQKAVIKIPTQIERFRTRNNVVIEFLNGQQVGKIIANTILRDRPNEFHQPVSFKSDVTMNLVNVQGLINSIRVPEDLMDRNSPQEIYGIKRFKSVHVHNINASLLNRLRIPADIVTLTKDEEIERDLDVDKLIVNGNLHVHGLFDGVNLTHLDQRYLESFKDNFHNLTFHQTVNVSRLIVKGHVNKMNLEQIYSNAYFKNDRVLSIPSKKIINNVFKCRSLVAGTINGYVLEDYFTVREPITFTKPVIFENDAYFGDVQLVGKIDDIPVAELLKEVVTLTTSQSLSGGLDFVDGIRVQDQLNVRGKINGMRPDDWLLYSKIQNITSPMRFTNEVKCGLLIRDGNIDVNQIDGYNFTKQALNLIQLNRPTSFNAMIHCVNCSASYVWTNYVNLKNFSQFLENYVSKTKPDQVIYGEKYFQAPQYFGDFQTTDPKKGVAGVDFKNLKHKAVTLDGYNIITNPVVIHGNLSLLLGQMTALRWNKIDLNSFNHEVVHRDHREKILVQGDVVYSTDVDLMADISVKRLNKYVPEQIIMTNNRNYTIYGDVRFNGKLIASNNVQVDGWINSINLTEFDRQVLKTNDRNEVVLNNDTDNRNGVINFVDQFQAEEILVEGLVDRIHLDRDSILMADGEQNIGKIILSGPQWFNGSINVMSRINDYDKDSLQQIVLINSPEVQHIDVQKTFGKVVVKEMNHYQGLINVNAINRINLTHFNSSVLYSDVDRVVNVPKKFQNNITVNNPNFRILGTVNGVRLADVIRLDRHRQTITGQKVFDTIVFNEDIDVHGLVNAVDVPKISENMLLVYGNQRIKTPIRFLAPVFMMSNNTVDWLNHFRPEDLVTIHGDRVLNGKFTFKNILVPKVYVPKHLVNGVNLTAVQQHGFMAEAEEQVLDGQLVINEAMFNQNVSLAANLNDLDLSETVESISQKFDPNFDSQQMLQRLFNHKSMIAHHKHYWEYVNFDIDYFKLPSSIDCLDRTDCLKLEDYSFWQSKHFQQHFKVLNITSENDSLFEALFQRRLNVWQTIRIRGQPSQLFVAEIWPKNNGPNQVFRLICLEQTTQKSWIVFDRELSGGVRPFLFSMDQSLFVIYFHRDQQADENCFSDQTDHPKLYRLDLDLSQLNHSHQWLQNFPQQQSNEQIKHIGHFSDQENFHYLVFNHDVPYSDDQQWISVYQRSLVGCHFRLFQTIPVSQQIKQISLFRFGIGTKSEPYLAMNTATHFNVWKQQGIHGFIKRWSIEITDKMRIGSNTGTGSGPGSPFILPFVWADNQFLVYISTTIECENRNLNRTSLFYLFEANFNQKLLPGTVLNLNLFDYV